MTETTTLHLVQRELEHGRLELALHADEHAETPIAALTIDRLQMHVDGTRMSVGGIGNVETDPGHRRRGHAARLLRVAVEHMREAEMQASLLYGIDGFYDRLGWRSCGDERWVLLPLEPADEPGLPATGRWVSRPMQPSDMPHIERISDQVARSTPGALAREPGGRAWSQLDTSDALVVERGGAVAGWAWRGRGPIWSRGELAAEYSDAAAWAELQAVDDEAMRAVAAAAIARSRELSDEPGRRWLVTGAPEEHPLRRLARAGTVRCRLVDEVRPTGGAMLLPLGDDVPERHDLYQFLPDRF